MTSTNRKRRGRIERQKKGRLVLTDRDREIIRAIYQFRFLTSNQLAERFFNSKSKTDRRLRDLFDHGYLDRIDRPTVSGKSELVYALWKNGAELLCTNQGMTKSELNWKPSKNNIKPERLQHELDIVSFHLAMDRSVIALPGVSWLFWQDRHEIIAKKTWELLNVGSAKGGKLKLIPDAFFGLQTPKGKTVFFLELDRGTESPRVFRDKLLAYQLAFERGLVQRATALKSFRVLTLVPDERRLRSLLKLAASSRCSLLFWFTVIETLNHLDLFITDCWLVPKTPQQAIALYK